MTITKDEWVKTAMTDDTVVVDLLVRLKQHSHPAWPPAKTTLLPLKWGLRLPRSKPITTSAATACERKEASTSVDFFRGSPTTPLSWSGGGSDESSRDRASCRSKATISNEPTSNTNTTKRTRRKKTFAELKEEESVLLKERIHLENDLAKLQVTFREQRATNDLLKRMKFDLGLHSASHTVLDNVEDRRNTMVTSTLTSLRTPTNEGLPAAAESCRTPTAVSSSRGSSFVLPDLNMMPSEENPGSGSLNVTS